MKNTANISINLNDKMRELNKSRINSFLLSEKYLFFLNVYIYTYKLSSKSTSFAGS